TRVSRTGSTSFRFSSEISTSPLSSIRRTDSSRDPGKNIRAPGCSRSAATIEARASKSALMWVARISMGGDCRKTKDIKDNKDLKDTKDTEETGGCPVF